MVMIGRAEPAMIREKVSIFSNRVNILRGIIFTHALKIAQLLGILLLGGCGEHYPMGVNIDANGTKSDASILDSGLKDTQKLDGGLIDASNPDCRIIDGGTICPTSYNFCPDLPDGIDTFIRRNQGPRGYHITTINNSDLRTIEMGEAYAGDSAYELDLLKGELSKRYSGICRDASTICPDESVGGCATGPDAGTFTTPHQFIVFLGEMISRIETSQDAATVPEVLDCLNEVKGSL